MSILAGDYYIAGFIFGLCVLMSIQDVSDLLKDIKFSK